ncbi:MAG: hypothetical protein ACP5NV_02080 [Candidatus Woesearchaeota archaeon]
MITNSIKKGLLIIFLLILFVNISKAEIEEYGCCTFNGGVSAAFRTSSNCGADGGIWRGETCVALQNTPSSCINYPHLQFVFGGICADVGETCATDISASNEIVCKCGDKYYLRQNGGYCENGVFSETPSRSIVACDTSSECGSWRYKIVKEPRDAWYTPDTLYDYLLKEDSNIFLWPRYDVGRNELLYTGDYSAEFWAYVSQTQQDISVRGQVDDIVTLTVSKWNYQTREQVLIFTYSKNCNPNCGGSSDRAFNFILGNLEQGWYNFSYKYTDLGGEDQINGGIYKSGVGMHTNNIFSIINPVPILTDLDVSKDFCEGDPVKKGEWIPSSVPSTNVPAQRMCCGDDMADAPGGDNTYTLPGTTLQCNAMTGKWVDLTNNDRCGPDDIGHFLPSLVTQLGSSYDPLATNGADACCGDDYIDCDDGRLECDLGYATPNNDYFCYNDKHSLFDPEADDSWRWISATDYEKTKDVLDLRIYYRDDQSKSTDIVSNSQKWFYCNANPVIAQNEGIGGLPINEYKTFTNSETTSFGEMECYAFMNLLYPQENYEACVPPGNDNYPCCRAGETIDLSNPLTYGDCDGHCKNSAGIVVDPCDNPLFAQFCDPLTIPLGGLDEDIEKSLCEFNLEGCLEESYFDPQRTCENQLPSGYGELCDKTSEVCANGRVISASNNPSGTVCCYGETATCEAINEQTCSELGGEPYDFDTEECTAGYTNMNIGGEDCCFGPVKQRTLFIQSILPATHNGSVICFEQDSKNIIGSCCFGSACLPFNYIDDGFTYLSELSGRAHGTGSSFHTIASFDKYSPDAGKVVDYVRKKKNTGTIFFNIDNKLNLSGFKYVEFNVAYNSILNDDVFINNRNYGDLKNWISGDNKEIMRWHRVIILIDESQKNEKISTIKFVPRINGERTILIDNIMLTPDSSNINSQNYYCTGGFTSWIADLDTNLSVESQRLGSPFYDEWTDYGPYKFACDAQGPFAWSGQQCCGDDTRPGTYGEHYNDTLLGCFGGMPVFDKSTVSYSANIIESIDEEAFEEYIYKDLIYNNSQFVSCQAPTVKYENVSISYDGTQNNYPRTNQGNLLVNRRVTNECTIIGDNYCSNQAWRNIVRGVPDWNGTIALAHKSIPPNANLLTNGDFGGECPASVCNVGTGNNGGS